MKYTPGPWFVGKDCAEFIDCPTGCIAQALGNGPEQNRANARLIAAAPDLYEACQTILNDCQAILDGDDMSGMSDLELFSAMLNTVLSAIKKVEATP